MPRTNFVYYCVATVHALGFYGQFVVYIFYATVLCAFRAKRSRRGIRVASSVSSHSSLRPVAKIMAGHFRRGLRMISLSGNAMIRQRTLETSAAEFSAGRGDLGRALRRRLGRAAAASFIAARDRRSSARGRATPGSSLWPTSRTATTIKQGRPLAGPAGKLFDAVLSEVGIDRRTSLRHAGRQALQVEAARARAARGAGERERGSSLLPVARSGTRGDSTGDHRLPRGRWLRRLSWGRHFA